jgi:hypothetical protein
VLLGGGAGAYLIFGGGLGGTAVLPSESAVPSVEPTVSIEPSASEVASPSATAPPPSTTPLASPTPEPTPQSGDTFAFYEVSVGPSGFTLYAVDDSTGAVLDTRTTSFAAFSYARAEPLRGSDGQIYWETQDGDLTGWSYRYPDSGDFRIRAVFLNDAGERRSAFLDEDQLTVFPEATPAP